MTTRTSTRRTRAAAALVALVALAASVTAAAPSAGAATSSTVRRAAPSTAVPDPGTQGPRAVTAESYDFGDTPLTFPGLPGPVEDRARVYRPVDLSGGPFPLVIFLHGRHEFCASGSDFSWPCANPANRVSSFRGYDKMAFNLASYGYIVASISANGINAADSGLSDGGADARGRLILHHLDRFKTWNATGGAPFGSTYVGKVDLTRIGLMGHSRGGEGVAAAVQLNQALPVRYGIKAALLLAPVDFARRKVHGVHLGVVLPYCDGDVSDLQGVHYVDDTLYDDHNDFTNRHTFLVEGANHNFFNTEWTPPARTGFDDGSFGDGSVCDKGAPGSIRLSASQQRTVGTAYINGFLRRYVTGEKALAPLFDGSKTWPPSIGSARVLSSFHSTAVDGRRRDVARLDQPAELSRDTLGGRVTTVDLYRDLCGGGVGVPSSCLGGLGFGGNEPHFSDNAMGLNQLRAAWGGASARVRFEVPEAKGDVTGFRALSFRGALNFSSDLNPAGTDTNVQVALVDSTGRAAIVNAAAYSRALRYPPGWTGGVGIPKLLLSTVRLPLSAFSGIDLHNIRRVTIVFDRRSRGMVDVANLAFTDKA
ncbi:MAG: hypothetical protein JWM05_2470 [Acidimicrobiales bacterium]|nr:hypothetical protein [Acidimicrobiales bacterium]